MGNHSSPQSIDQLIADMQRRDKERLEASRGRLRDKVLPHSSHSVPTTSR